ncbi:hypothetical protein AURDEDRAFT_189093 [Auricularia subglabra TFB-10046 SS5]|uniref:Uncharacterized protein n=1 Tax=Auricularia subglabra (strain TFB-10046 / SS5) TaxID=717982 RepID=J0WLI7_AURST|nr:hypothetical protein AURDEDRAFT_189093 [Auricularia subglabra TFB-10046 SS5]
MAYVDALLDDSGHTQDVDKALVAVLVDPSFLTSIFEQRAAFRSRCRTSASAGNAILVFWTDDLLVSLSNLSTALVCDHAYAESVPLALQKITKAAQLRAATQLPELWRDLAVSLQSEDASPACKRLATSLLYAAYCLRPLLAPDAEDAHGDDTSIAPFLRQYLHRLDPLSDCQDVEPLTLAMLLALYAQADRSCSDLPLLVPLTTSVLHDILLTLFSDDSPSHALGRARTLILRWSRVVPWAWSFFRLDLHECAMLSLTNAWAAFWMKLYRSEPSLRDLSVMDLAHSALVSVSLGPGSACSAASRVGAALAVQCLSERIFLFSLLVLLLRDDSNTFAAGACHFLAAQLLHNRSPEDLVMLALEYLSLSSPVSVKKALEPVSLVWKQGKAVVEV